MLVSPAPAAGQSSNELITLDQVSFGTLLFKLEEGSEQHIRAPLLSSKYEIDVTGTIARTTLTQRFINPSDFWLEGVYAFPLPNSSAVDGLRMQIGDRFIEGQIKEKKAARQTYEAAKAAGKKTALLVQHRPNLFTNSVANIGPRESVVVQISYQQVIEPDSGTYTLRAPLVAAPRYEPEPVIQMLMSGPDGWKPVNRDPVGVLTNAAVRFSALADGKTATHNPVDIIVRLKAGFPIGELTSSSHSVFVSEETENSAVVRLDSEMPADRDFVLTWSPQEFGQPKVSFFKETLEDAVYYLAMVTPPKAEQIKVRPRRNIIFVQDVSGSMSGESIRQARAGLKIALKRLKRDDRFNVFFFNDQLRALSEHLLPASRRNVARALATTEDIDANGGTEMLPALIAALRLAHKEARERLTQIVFLTDSGVSNEAEMMKAIDAGLGASRLFTVGIGSSPNSYFMSAAAEVGRGSTVYVSDLATVAEKMERLFTKLESPALIDLKISLPNNVYGLTPNPLPDLYAGEPLVVAFVADRDLVGKIRITGSQGTKLVELTFDPTMARERPGIAKLWARKNINGIEKLRKSSITNAADAVELDDQILGLALRHHLVSSRTSLVALDVTPARDSEEPLYSQQIANNLPKGWDSKAFFSPIDAHYKLREASLSPETMARLQYAALRAASQSDIKLPKTSLDWAVPTLFGMLLLIVSSGVLIWVSWHKRKLTVGSER